MLLCSCRLAFVRESDGSHDPAQKIIIELYHPHFGFAFSFHFSCLHSCSPTAFTATKKPKIYHVRKFNLETAPQQF